MRGSHWHWLLHCNNQCQWEPLMCSLIPKLLRRSILTINAKKWHSGFYPEWRCYQALVIVARVQSKYIWIRCDITYSTTIVSDGKNKLLEWSVVSATYIYVQNHPWNDHTTSRTLYILFPNERLHACTPGTYMHHGDRVYDAMACWLAW